MTVIKTYLRRGDMLYVRWVQSRDGIKHGLIV